MTEAEALSWMEREIEVPQRAIAALINCERPPGPWVRPGPQKLADGMVLPGTPIIRVEARQLIKLANRDGILDIVQMPVVPAGPGYSDEVLFDGKWADYHRQERESGRPCEWDAFSDVRDVCGLTLAIETTSWGPTQVMGYHWRKCLYASAAGLAAAASTIAGCADLSVRAFRLHDIIDPLRKQNWFEVATKWNGPGQPDAYAKNLKKAYDRIGGVA